MDSRHLVVPVIDSHTAGEPTRVILRCPWRIPGKTMEEKRLWFEKNCDNFRRVVLSEPRGHRDMFGALLVDPTHSDADFGVFFLENEATLRMCVHGSMGVAATLFAMGFPKNEMILEAPSGLIRARLQEKSKGFSIALQNVPSFFVDSLTVECTGRQIPVDISWGGNLFALVRAKDLSISLEIRNLPRLVELGTKLREEINKKFSFVHPLLQSEVHVDLVEIYDEDRNPPINVVIFGRGQVDRSPCGTGTSAKVATLFAKGKLGLGEEYRYRSILNTEFLAKIVGKEQVGPYEAIVPEIQGEVYLSSFQFLVLTEGDPFPSGFQLD